MNVFDIIVLICFALGIIEGIRKGFISQIAAIVGVVAGVWLSVIFAGKLSEWMSGLFEANPQLMKALAFTTIYAVVVMLLHLAGKLLEKVVKLSMLGWLNKLLGAVFSLMKWALILCVAVVVFDSFNSAFHVVGNDKLANSIFYESLHKIAGTVFPYLKTLLFGGSTANV